MLNKELILYGSADLPYTHTMRVGRDETSSYLFIGTLNGNLSPNTVLINGHSIEVGAIYSGYEKYNNLDYWQLFFLINWYSPVADLYLGRTDTKEVVFCNGYDFDTGNIEYNTYAQNVKFTEKDVGKDLHLWIATTPPPWA